jgi:hypothetical protein
MFVAGDRVIVCDVERRLDGRHVDVVIARARGVELARKRSEALRATE